MKKRIGIYTLLVFVLLGSCMNDTNDDGLLGGPTENLILLLIDGDSIEPGIAPNNFTEADINDQIAEIGLRDQLKFFAENRGKTISLYAGKVGDEGIFALKRIPNKWINAGPTDSGARNFLSPGPGLGSPNIDNDRTVLLDGIADVYPLRATGLKMLVGYKVMAVVYKGDIGVNYSPFEANLQGANLGVVAFEILDISRWTNAGPGFLPALKIRILDVEEVGELDLALFSNPPMIQSSSAPFDVDYPASVPGPIFAVAN